MILTEENYYSKETDMEWASKSQYTNFFGTLTTKGCEKRALAELRGEYTRPPSDPMLLGSFVDTMLLTPNEQEKFIASHPEMFSSRGATKGQLLAKFGIAFDMVNRCKRDEFFMKTLKGDHQTIMTGTIFDVPFKIKMDVFNDGKYITDLKTTSDWNKEYYSPELKHYVNFMQAFGYDLQGAIYREIVFQNTGKRLPFFISAVSSQAHPRINVFRIDDESMDLALQNAEDNIRSLPLLKSGELVPTHCGECDYCADNEPLKRPVDWLGREEED